MAPQASNLCTACDKPTTKRCNRCKNAQYCSSECQKSDWSSHKLLCATFADFDISTRPSNDHYRAILFPEDREKIEVVWLHAPWAFYGGYRSSKVEDYLGPRSTPYFIPIDYNPVLKRQPQATLQIACRDEGGSRINKSIRKICATKPGWDYLGWQGPVVAYAKVGFSIDPVDCRDFTMNDFRHIADYLLWYCARKQVVGVVINCLGDQQMRHKPVFEEVKVSNDNPIFVNHDTSDIADRVGLSLYTRKCLPDSKWANDRQNQAFEKDPFNNPKAAYLHLCLDPNADVDSTEQLGWGWPHMKWNDDVGSVLVVRQDRKPLSTFDIEALCKYCQDEIHPLFERSTGEDAEGDPLSSDDLLAMISQPGFANKWREWQTQKSAGSEDRDAPSPWGL